MKLYKLKDSIAIFWFIIIIYLIKLNKIQLVIGFLSLGALFDLIIVMTDLGKKDLFIS